MTHEPLDSIAEAELLLDPRVAGLGRSPTLEINERSLALQQQGIEVLKLGLGQSPFPVPEEVVAALRKHAHRKDYLQVEGLAELRHMIATHHRLRHGLDFDGDQILVGPGSKELIFLTQLALDAELLLPCPSWVSYQPQARILGRPTRWLPTSFEGRWLLTPEILDQACQAPSTKATRLLILNSPNNPTGLSYQPGELRRLAEVAKHHRIIVLSDEIYGELGFSGQHISISRFYPEGTLVSSGLSKWCGAGGWRLGTLAVPAELSWLRSALAEIASETFTAVSAPIQHAAITAFTGSPALEEFLHHQRRILSALGHSLTATLRSAGARVHDPDGAFYLFVDFAELAPRLRERGLDTAPTLCERLLADTGVATLPGPCFGRTRDELCLRLSYVDFDGGPALSASIELSESGNEETPLGADFLDTYCPRTVEAVARMATWLSR